MSELRQVRKDEIEKILQLQEDCFAVIDSEDWLRRNTRETFELCLQQPNYCLGCFEGDYLIAIGIMQICGHDRENLGYQLDYPEERLDEVGNMKLVLVEPDYRGHGLQRRLMGLCEQYARKQGLKVLATTVHPDNVFSRRNVEMCGYQYHSEHRKYGGLIRRLYYKNL